MPEGIGPPGTKMTGRWPNDSAPISSPGTILSHTPRHSAASNMLCDSATAVAIDDIATEQRQFHARQALGDTVAHRRNAAGKLSDRAGLACCHLDQRRKALERLMRRQHV